MTTKNDLPILYVKAGCPWCVAALDFFRKKDIKLHIIDVYSDVKAMTHLEKLTGKNKCPTLEYGDVFVADFSVEEFIAEASKNIEMKAYFKL